MVKTTILSNKMIFKKPEEKITGTALIVHNESAHFIPEVLLSSSVIHCLQEKMDFGSQGKKTNLKWKRFQKRRYTFTLKKQHLVHLTASVK